MITTSGRDAERAINNRVINYLEEAKTSIGKAKQYSSLTVINNLTEPVTLTVMNDLDNLILDIRLNGDK